MATVNFLYRSLKENAPLNVRLLFRHNDKDFVIGAKSELFIYSYKELTDDSKLSAKRYWTELHNKKKVRDIDISNKQIEVQGKINALENYILQEFEKASSNLVANNKNWLKAILEQFYRPKTQANNIPLELVPFFDYYIENKKNELSTGRIKTLNVTKSKLKKFEQEMNYAIKISSINESFKNDFIGYSNSKSYSLNTQHKDLKIIKTVCRFAKYLGLETHPQMEMIKLPSESIKSIYLNFEELGVLESIDLKQEYLDNARDWLLISCYTGQRVSDFMRFNKSQIRKEKESVLIEFTQKKTDKIMTVPLHPKVLGILEKRDGEFPRATSDQKYNEYIKVICQKAEINEKCTGKKRVSISAEGVKPTKNDYRDVSGKFKKWELVTSHIGRRSFATNFYGKIPTSHLIYITGHSTEAMFLKYIGKSNKDMALEITKYFN
jgi:integrase